MEFQKNLRVELASSTGGIPEFHCWKSRVPLLELNFAALNNSNAKRRSLKEIHSLSGCGGVNTYSSFACMPTSCNTKPQRGVTKVASRFNGWYKAAWKKRAFRYATSNPCRVPTARYPSTSSIPAIEMAGYHCQMPTASLPKLEIHT